MSICGYGFSEPYKEICGDEVPAGQKYCVYHSYDEEIALRRHEEEQDALHDYRDSLESGYHARDPRDYD